jgi:predicted RNase H-like nuclease
MGIRKILLEGVEKESKKAGEELVKKMQIIDDHVITQQENLIEFEEKYLKVILEKLDILESSLDRIEGEIRNIKHNMMQEDVKDGYF